MSIAFGEMAAGKIGRQFVVDAQPSALDEFRRLTDIAKAIGLELKYHGVGERVIDREHIDILGTDPGHPPDPLAA